MWLVCGSCVTRAIDYNPIKMRGLKCLRQEVSQDFSVFSVLIPASGGSLLASPQKDHYPTSCINGIKSTK